MKNKITLRAYVDELTTKLNLIDTEQNKKAIQKKFERTLKSLDKWENADTIKIARTSAKTFDIQMLEQVKLLNQAYLRKFIDIDKDELEYQKMYVSSLLDDNTQNDQQVSEELFNRLQLEEQKFQMLELHAMVKALFEEHFTPIDMALYRSDLYRQRTTVINENNRLETEILLTRLSKPDLKGYYQKK